jgi:hypothetical protein
MEGLQGADGERYLYRKMDFGSDVLCGYRKKYHAPYKRRGHVCGVREFGLDVGPDSSNL